jgi:hypothetical protein
MCLLWTADDRLTGWVSASEASLATIPSEAPSARSSSSSARASSLHIDAPSPALSAAASRTASRQKIGHAPAESYEFGLLEDKLACLVFLRGVGSLKVFPAE